jgi:DNA mismatch endonuclease, patch repair protein
VSAQRTRDPQVTSRIMSAIRNRDSRAELALRRALHSRGFRYRLHAKDVLGSPDLVVRKYRLAVFVDGDLWHGNAWRLRNLTRLEDLFPNRTDWWVQKIRRNIERDRHVTDQLQASGWRVLRIWESEILRGPAASADSVARAIVELRASLGNR